MTIGFELREQTQKLKMKLKWKVGAYEKDIIINYLSVLLLI